MAGNADEAGTAPQRKSKRLVLIALPLALALGAGSFYGVYSGLVPLPFGAEPAPEAAAEAKEPPFGPQHGAGNREPAAYVALEPLVVTLGPQAAARHLKLSVQIETNPEAQAGVAAVAPRIADVLNTFLRAVDESDVAEPHAMIRLRAQMLRRVRLVTPPGSVRDLLIQQFVLN